MPDVEFGSWIPDVDQRKFPYVNIRRLGGLPTDPELLDKPVIELTAYGDVSLPDTENVYLDARTVIYRMWLKQVVTPAGHISSYFETMGPSQFDSPFDDTFRVQGLIQLGLRPPR